MVDVVTVVVMEVVSVVVAAAVVSAGTVCTRTTPALSKAPYGNGNR